MYEWDKKCPHESDKAYGYALTFFELGYNRTVSKVRKEHNNDISYSKLVEYSHKYFWEERANNYDSYRNEKRTEMLKEESDEYFKKRREAFNSYDEIIDTIMAELTRQILDGEVEITDAGQTIQTLTNSIVALDKFHLRLLNEPAELTDIVKTQQEVTVNDVETPDILSDDFMENELEVLKKIVDNE